MDKKNENKEKRKEAAIQGKSGNAIASGKMKNKRSNEPTMTQEFAPREFLWPCPVASHKLICISQDQGLHEGCPFDGLPLQKG